MRLEPDGRILQDVFFLIKETTGVSDFVGTAGVDADGPNEAEKMLDRVDWKGLQVKMEFEPGDNVTINEPVRELRRHCRRHHSRKGLVRVLVTIFGRQAPVELEYWQSQGGRIVQRRRPRRLSVHGGSIDRSAFFRRWQLSASASSSCPAVRPSALCR